MEAGQLLSISPETVDTWAKLIENHGALMVFAIVSGLTNAYFITQIVRGKLIPHKLYKKAVDEADRLQATMENEHDTVMLPLLGFISGLKSSKKEVKGDADNGNDQ